MGAPVDASQLRHFISTARRATLATRDPSGRPRLVPICFVVDEDGNPADARDVDAAGRTVTLYSAVDEKPKRSPDPMGLGRVRDIVARPTATVLIDRWDEDWSRLAWARLDCEAEIVPAVGEADAAPRARAIAALRAKYPQYRGQRLEDRPLIRLRCHVGARWGDPSSANGGPDATGVRSAEVQPDVEAM